MKRGSFIVANVILAAGLAAAWYSGHLAVVQAALWSSPLVIGVAIVLLIGLYFCARPKHHRDAHFIAKILPYVAIGIVGYGILEAFPDPGSTLTPESKFRAVQAIIATILGVLGSGWLQALLHFFGDSDEEKV